MAKYLCPVCGYDELAGPPYDPDGDGTFEICPSCGFEFGVTDDDKGFTPEQWRRRWIESGMRWSYRNNQPSGWDPVAQLARVQPPNWSHDA